MTGSIIACVIETPLARRKLVWAQLKVGIFEAGAR
jgi:hypothetical protein